MAKKRVLIITYYWPPSGGSGVQRWAYFAKYLEQFGVVPIVLTVDPKKASYPSIDNDLLKDVEHIEVHRTSTFEPLQIYSLLTTGKKKEGIPYGSIETKSKSPIKKLGRYVRANLILPDARKYWNSYALKAARKLIQNNEIDVVVTTGPPHSTHLIGEKLKTQFNIPWLVDFRDPWSEMFYNQDLPMTKASIKKNEDLEVSILNKADKVVTVSQYIADLLLKKSKKSKNDIHIIENGYDDRLFKEKYEKKTQNTIAYVGYLGKHHNYELLVEGLSIFVKQYPENEITLELAGNIEPVVLELLKQKLSIQIENHGIVSHEAAIQLMQEAHVLLFTVPKTNYIKGLISGKIFEYIASKTPVISLNSDAEEANKIISQFDTNFVVENPNEMASAINNCIMNTGNSQPTNDKISQYSRENLTRKLGNIIKVM
ncbi:MAG: hypothetical protein COA32_00505 [Fluviicola sp.]|nr:MAG: hypothetical protein COA32_00505 [Fluviicola sp.]